MKKKKEKKKKKKTPLLPDGIKPPLKSQHGWVADNFRWQRVSAVDNSEGEKLLTQTCAASDLFQRVLIWPSCFPLNAH